MTMYNCRSPGVSSDEDDSDDDFGFSTTKPKQNRNQNSFFSQSRFENPEEELFDAVIRNNLQKVKELISKDVNLNALKGGWIPLMYSTLHSLPEMTKLLLENGSNINFNKDFFTPLMSVCTNSILGSIDQKVKCVEILLDHGININATDRFQMSALMLAARKGLSKIVQLLVDKNCEINRQDKDGWNALFHAVNCNKSDVVDILLASGANVKLKDLEGQTANDLAMNKGYKSIAAKIKVKKSPDEVEPTLFSRMAYPVIWFRQLMNETPSKNIGTNPGFPSDVYDLLVGMNLQIYAERLYSNNIQLGEFFLVMNDDQLKEVGVWISGRRQKVLTFMKRFHLRRWQKASIGLKPINDPIYVLDGLKFMWNTVRQLHVLQTSINNALLNKPEVHPTNELKRVINSSLNAIEYIEKELITLKRFGVHTDIVQKVQPVDLIKDEDKKEKYKNILKLSVICALGATILWKNRYGFLSSLKLI